jgi:hypothetical protein
MLFSSTVYTGYTKSWEYLRILVKGTWGKQIHEKNLKSKISCQTPFKKACNQFHLGCALTFASKAKFEIEAKISLRFEAKKKPDFT